MHLGEDARAVWKESALSVPETITVPAVKFAPQWVSIGQRIIIALVALAVVYAVLQVVLIVVFWRKKKQFDRDFNKPLRF